MENKFKEWLASDDYNSFFMKEDGEWLIKITRVKVDEDFDYLYLQRDLFNNYLQRDLFYNWTKRYDLQYAGIYCRKDGFLYDLKYPLVGLLSQEELDKSQEIVRIVFDDINNFVLKLADKVKKIIEEKVDNDRKNLEIKDVSEERRYAIKEFCQYMVKNAVYDAYLFPDRENARRFDTFRCQYRLESFSEKDLLDYIRDPEALAALAAENFWRENQEDMLAYFLMMDCYAKERSALMDDLDNPIHTVKRIISALAGIEAKTVKVTVEFEGKTETFSTNIGPLLRNPSNTYPLWEIAAADRKKVEKLFHTHDGYRPKDIKEISYKGRVLYSA